MIYCLSTSKMLPSDLFVCFTIEVKGTDSLEKLEILFLIFICNFKI